MEPIKYIEYAYGASCALILLRCVVVGKHDRVTWGVLLASIILWPLVLLVEGIEKLVSR